MSDRFYVMGTKPDGGVFDAGTRATLAAAVGHARTLARSAPDCTYRVTSPYRTHLTLWTTESGDLRERNS